MRWPVRLWAVCFGFATLGVAAVGLAVAAAPIGTSVRPIHGDLVAVIAPRQTATCELGQVVTASVIGLTGDTVSVGRKTVVSKGRRYSRLRVNGQLVSLLPTARVQSLSAMKIPPHRVFLLGTGRASGCDSLVLGSVVMSNLVGYTQGGLDARVAVVQQRLDDRVHAEKYVIGVYLVVVAFFLLWLLIHTGKVVRHEREISELLEVSRPTREPDSKS